MAPARSYVDHNQIGTLFFHSLFGLYGRQYTGDMSLVSMSGIIVGMHGPQHRVSPQGAGPNPIKNVFCGERLIEMNMVIFLGGFQGGTCGLTT